MKVLLVEPPISPLDVTTGLLGLPEPLALETIAAKLCQNHEVEILDMRIEPDKLEGVFLRFEPDVIATGSVTSNNYLAKEILRKAKQYFPNSLTVIGGHHVTFCPQDANESYIDVIVLGEGDETFSLLVNTFETKQNLMEIRGIIINREGEQRKTPARDEYIEMDDMPWPARHLVEKYRTHYFQRTYRPIVSLNTSRGCPYRCAFCALWKLNGGKYRFRSAELVINEVETLKEKFIDFIDDNSLENIPRINLFAELMIKRKINKKFKLYARADTIAKNPETIAKLAEAGLELLLVGFESMNQKKMNDWNKRSTVGINIRAIEILHKYKVKIIAYFLIDPLFDYTDFSELWKYVEDMKLMSPIFTVVTPLPGTDFYEQQKNNFAYNNLSFFDLFHTVFKTRLPLKEFYNQFSLLYEKSYSLDRQLKNMPANIPRTMLEEQSKNITEIYTRIRELEKHYDKRARV